jgi:hypothetical protein
MIFFDFETPDKNTSKPVSIPTYIIHFNVPLNVGMLSIIQHRILQEIKNPIKVQKVLHIVSSQNMKHVCDSQQMIFLEKESILLIFTPAIRQKLSKFFKEEIDFEIFEEQFKIIEKEFSIMPGMSDEETMFP